MKPNEIIDFVFCFYGNKKNNALIASGIFSTVEEAKKWIEKELLSGTLIKQPVGISTYDWIVQNQFFQPKKEYQFKPDFIANFSSAYLEHYHFENGIMA